MSIEAVAGFTAGGAALLGVAVGAFFWLLTVLRTEIGGLRTEVRQEIAGLRTEVREEIGGLRTEVKEDNARLRQELLAEIREGNERILQALYHHRHDPDGTAVFYPPQAAD